MADLIDLNSATVRELTQLPGVSKSVAYNLVNHRKRHGEFTDWAELLEVKHFPAERLDELKQRATLRVSDPQRQGTKTRRSARPQHVNAIKKRTSAYTKRARASRRTEKMHDHIRDRAA